MSIQSYTIGDRKADGSYDLTWVYHNTYVTHNNKNLQPRVRAYDANNKFIYIYPMNITYNPDNVAPTITTLNI